MKKTLAFVTCFLLLFSAVDSVSMLRPVHAESQTTGIKGFTSPAELSISGGKTGKNQGVPFFYDVPLPEAINQYIPGDLRGHWAESYLLHFVYSDILKGYEVSKGKYEIKPEGKITRAEFVTLLVRALGLKNEGPGIYFDDVPTDQWFYEPISIASEKGIVNGVDAKHFAPERYVQRDEMAVMMIRAFKGTLDQSGSLKTFTDVPADHWAKEEIDEAVKANVINGYKDNTFLPKNPATRAEAVKMLFTALVAQNSNLPQDQELIDSVVNMDKELLEALQVMDFERAGEILDHYSFGFNKVMGSYGLALYQEILNKEDNLLNFTNIGDYKVDILAKSNGIASVKVSNVTHQIVKMKDDTIIAEYKETLNNIIYLRKMADGQWKAYYNMPDVSK